MRFAQAAAAAAVHPMQSLTTCHRHQRSILSKVVILGYCARRTRGKCVYILLAAIVMACG
jgi:hypothetical protein